MMHSFTVTFGTKHLTGILTGFPLYETFNLIKNNILHQSKSYKIKCLRYVTFRSHWSCNIQFHEYSQNHVQLVQKNTIYIVLSVSE